VTHREGRGARELRAALIEGVQAEAGAAYARASGRQRCLPYGEPAARLRAELGAEGVRVAVDDGEVRGAATFRLAHYGCVNDAGERLAAVATRSPRARA